jgi:hypothetical protein
MINLSSIGRFGKRILGKERFEKEQQIQKVAANRFGRKVTGIDATKVLQEAAGLGAAAATAPTGEQNGQPTGGEAETGEQQPATLVTVSADSPPISELRGDEEQGGESAASAEAAGTGETGAVDIARLSVNQLAVLLQENPRLLDGALALELQREKGPRKAALMAMLAVEESQKQPRQEVLDRLRAELAKLG